MRHAHFKPAELYWISVGFDDPGVCELKTVHLGSYSMALNVSEIKQQNLWGKAATEGLEPQRADLFMLDLDSASKGVAKAAGTRALTLLPQFARSVTFPENRVKSEPVRRDSIPYQMPSWDDPLDPVKIVFFLDTSDTEDSSSVVEFLDTWLALVRAGRGSRKNGFSSPAGHLLLNSDYRVDFNFNVTVHLLRGCMPAPAQVTAVSAVRDSYYRFQQLAKSKARRTKLADGLVQLGVPVDALLNETLSYPQPPAPPFTTPTLLLHTSVLLCNAWLGAYKLSDFNYGENTLTTVEATFYVEDVRVGDTLPVSGAAVALLE